MYKKLMIIPAAFVAFACSGNDKKIDDALNADLMTAAQVSPYTPLDSISAAERLALTAPAAALTSTAAAPRRSTPVRRTTTRRRASSGGTYSSSPVYSAPAPAREPQIIKHTKRDAAIGAVAGGVLGAATSRNKVKGAIIGATAGAIIGGVIGNNVDVERRY